MKIWQFEIAHRYKLAAALASMLLLLLFGAAMADGQTQSNGHDEIKQPQMTRAQKETELAKQSQDPLSGLIMLPIQNNFDMNISTLNKTAYELLIEPTFPIKINDDWRILTHTVIPVVSMPEIESGKTTSGLSNIMVSALLSPASKGKWSWGVGGGVMLPTASNTNPLTYTNTPTGYDSWAAGPAVVGVFKNGPWVAGALFNQLWSFDSAADTKINAMQIQGFAFYNMGKGYSLGYMPLINIDWTKSASQSTLLPVGLDFGKLFMIGGVFPLGLSAGGAYNVLRPDNAPEYQWRIQLFFVMPESMI